MTTSLLIVAGYWPSQQNPISGIFIVQQVEAFAQQGIHCDILVPTTRFRGGQDLLSVAELGLPEDLVSLIEVPSFRLPEKLSSLPGAIALNTRLLGSVLAKTLRHQADHRQYDGCILHGVRYAGFCLAHWRQYLSCPIVAVLHGVDPFIVKNSNLPRIRPILSSVGTLLDAVVLVGTPLRKHALEIGLPQEKLRVIANGVVLPAASPLGGHLKSAATPIRVLSVANLIPLKGIDDNLKALARIADQHSKINWEYVIVGDGPFRPDLEALTERLGLQSQVRFLGRLPYQETQAEMAKADVFSLPSWNEAFGIVYLEAMAQGVPVVGCLENGAADIVTHERDGLLIRPKSVEDLELALLQLLSDADLRGEMGRCARVTAESYSWDRNASALLELLSVTASSASPLIV